MPVIWNRFCTTPGTTAKALVPPWKGVPDPTEKRTFTVGFGLPAGVGKALTPPGPVIVNGPPAYGRFCGAKPADAGVEICGALNVSVPAVTTQFAGERTSWTVAVAVAAPQIVAIGFATAAVRPVPVPFTTAGVSYTLCVPPAKIGVAAL